jgi:hypothetical protein
VAPAVHARALADKAVLVGGWGVTADSLQQARQALAIARELGDPTLLLRALTACAAAAALEAETAQPYFTEATALARSLGDRWRLSQILGWQAYSAFIAGDPIAARAAGEEGRDLADAVGDHFVSRMCRCWGVGAARMIQGDLAAADAVIRELVAEAEAAGDMLHAFLGHLNQAYLHAFNGDAGASRAESNAGIDTAAQLGGEFYGRWPHDAGSRRTRRRRR